MFSKIKVIILTIIPVLVYLIPINSIEANPAPCIFRVLFDVNCIGCGITRACINAIHFNFERAMEYNKLVIIVLPLCIICYVNYYIKTVKKIKNYK